MSLSKPSTVRQVLGPDTIFMGKSHSFLFETIVFLSSTLFVISKPKRTSFLKERTSVGLEAMFSNKGTYFCTFNRPLALRGHVTKASLKQ